MSSSNNKFIDKFANLIERSILIIIIIMTVGAVLSELYNVYEKQSIALADLLLLFIYAEVIAMVAAYLKSSQVPVIYPIFIAITALSRLIILQGKDMDPEYILYEGAAILMLSIAVVILHSDFARDLLSKFKKDIQTGDE